MINQFPKVFGSFSYRFKAFQIHQNSINRCLALFRDSQAILGTSETVPLNPTVSDWLVGYPWPEILFWSSALALVIFSSFRHKMITLPPLTNISCAVSNPIPTLAPVITIVLPSHRYFRSKNFFVSERKTPKTSQDRPWTGNDRPPGCLLLWFVGT